jgi:predicted CXXCH cytochrome family protein
MTPHFLNTREMPFTLPVDPGCLHCHASDVQEPLRDARNYFSRPPFPRGRLTCEDSHGNPAQHLAQHGKGPILNPAKLDPVHRESICLECHLEGEVAVVKLGHRLGEFRPGDNLFDYAAFFEDGRKAGAQGRATSQWESLLESACKRASGDRLTCTTCHDPHSSVPADERAAYYRSRCLSCHAGMATGHHDDNPDCTSCHMPREQTEDIAHEQVTDHRIQIVSKPYVPPYASQELVPIGGLQPGIRDQGIAWAEFALEGHRDAGEHAIPLLQKAETTDPKEASDSELHMELGFLEQLNGSGDRAMQEYRQALHADSFNEIAASNLAVLEAQQGDFAAALPLWEKAFKDDPGASAAGVDLAVGQCRLGQTDAAEQTLRRVLLFSPDDGAARRLALAITAGAQRCGGR